MYIFNVKNSFYSTIIMSNVPQILHDFDFSIVYFHIDNVYQT